MTSLDGYMLKKPCKNCPFSPLNTRIRFACRERAEEIEETAYRHGFPCHLSAREYEYDGGESSGYVFGENTQHCAGAIMMYMKEGESCWPGVYNDDELVDALWDYMDWKAPHYESVEDFLDNAVEKRK